jgi:hypothetical protein
MTTPTCPRCLGPIPNRLDPGAYPGALSRVDNFTEVCSDCGLEEAVEQWTGTLRPRSEWPARAGAL